MIHSHKQTTSNHLVCSGNDAITLTGTMILPAVKTICFEADAQKLKLGLQTFSELEMRSQAQKKVENHRPTAYLILGMHYCTFGYVLN